MKEQVFLLGFDVGGTKIGIGLGDNHGKILGRVRIENKDTRPEDVLPQLAAGAKKLIDDAGLTAQDVAGFGISSPSPADIPNGIITTPPNNPFWRNVPIKQYLQNALGIRGFFENDANCGALAEWFFGAGKGSKDMIYLTMSTGIGAGIIAGGHLIQGKSFLAGEFGHIALVAEGRQCNCGLKGCYEAYCGGRALAQRMQQELAGKPTHPMMEFVKEGKLENIDLLSLEKAARANVEYAVKLWDEMCYRNAQAYGALLNTFNPEKLVLGTIAWAAGDFFLNPVKAYLPRFAWKEMLDACEIVPSALQRDIASYAGLAGAANALAEAGEIPFPA